LNEYKYIQHHQDFSLVKNTTYIPAYTIWHPRQKICVSHLLAKVFHGMMQYECGFGAIRLCIAKQMGIYVVRDHRCVLVSDGPHCCDDTSVSRQNHPCGQVNRLLRQLLISSCGLACEKEGKLRMGKRLRDNRRKFQIPVM
jgi:hypothetical protein